MLREPGEALRLVAQRDRVEVERVAGERTPDDTHVIAQLPRHVLDHPVVRGRRRPEDRDVLAECRQQPADAPVVRHELVAPVADAVRLVDHEHADRALDPGQQPRGEVLVREPLGGDEQDVDPVGGEVVLDRGPVVAVGRVDGHGAQAEPVRSLDLVPHQRQQRADDERGAVACVAADAGGDPVDEALAPARALDDEGPRAVADDGVDGLALPVAERGTQAEHRLEVALDRVGGKVCGECHRMEATSRLTDELGRGCRRGCGRHDPGCSLGEGGDGQAIAVARIGSRRYARNGPRPLTSTSRGRNG